EADAAMRAHVLARAARRDESGGFTLVELTVALVAGLIVGMAVVGISKEVTNTFHEEQRTAAAEMQLRTAMDRIRADLQRAAYMTTPTVGAAADKTLITAYTARSTAFLTPANAQLQRLSSIRLYDGGSVGKPASSFLVAGTDEGAAKPSALNGV